MFWFRLLRQKRSLLEGFWQLFCSLFIRKRWPFLPLNVVMSDIEWSSLENKSHSLKVEQEDRKDLGSCWLPQLYESTWSISGLSEPIESEFLFLCTWKDNRSYPGNEYDWGRPLRQRNNSCTALSWKQKVVPCGQRAVSEEAGKAGELVGVRSCHSHPWTLDNNLYLGSLQTYWAYNSSFVLDDSNWTLDDFYFYFCTVENGNNYVPWWSAVWIKLTSDHSLL